MAIIGTKVPVDHPAINGARCYAIDRMNTSFLVSDYSFETHQNLVSSIIEHAGRDILLKEGRVHYFQREVNAAPLGYPYDSAVIDGGQQIYCYDNVKAHPARIIEKTSVLEGQTELQRKLRIAGNMGADSLVAAGIKVEFIEDGALRDLVPFRLRTFFISSERREISRNIAFIEAADLQRILTIEDELIENLASDSVDGLRTAQLAIQKANYHKASAILTNN